MNFLTIAIQVFLCFGLVSAKLHIVIESWDIYNLTENNLNDTLDKDNGHHHYAAAATVVTNNEDVGNGVDLITSTADHQIKDVDVVVTNSTTISTLHSASTTATEQHKAAAPLPSLWFTNQRPLRQQSPASPSDQTSRATAFKSNNEQLKLNKLKAFSKVPAAVDTETVGGGGVATLVRQSFESYTKNDMSNRTNMAGPSVVPAQHDIEANNDKNNSSDSRKPHKQVNHRKFYTSNSLPPLSFGQLPQFLKQQQQQQQHLPLALPPLPTQVYSYQQHSPPPPPPTHRHHPLADYRLLFNAERHTEFYLYTRRTPAETLEDPDDSCTKKQKLAPGAGTTPTTLVNATIPDGSRVLHVVGDTIGAAFGVMARPVAGMPGIRLEQLQLYDARSLRQSRFNPFNPTRILIHGWLGGSTAGLYNTLIPELLGQQNANYNVITVDWGKGAIADYITASYRVMPVGNTLAKFIDFLHRESGTLFENIQLVGFSMGAHVAGIAGKHVQTGRLPIIYALDPALPLFRYDNLNERVDKSDADYVEVIHTSAGSYGYDRPLGHVDFYVNFGSAQPGCYFNECSHFRAFQIFAQSLRREVFEGIGCAMEMWPEMLKAKKCSQETGHKLTMTSVGKNLNEKSVRRGVYYVLTNAHAPYRL